MRLKMLAAALSMALTLTAPFQAAHAQKPFPERPIRIINPNPAGAGVDTLIRAFATELGKELNQSVIVENKPGAGGTIGVDAGAKAAPDGYTLTVTSSAIFTVAPLVYAKLPFNPKTDFIPLSIVASAGYVLVANPKLPARTVPELIQYARSNPGKLTYASTGNGTTTHLVAESFKKKAGVQITHVPYRGGGQALTDLIAGQVDLLFSNVPNAIGTVTNGQVRALGVSSPGREPMMPSVPTIAQSGLPGFEAVGWHGLSLPKGTPQDVVRTLSEAVMKASKHPEYVASMRDKGFTVVGSTPDAMAKGIEEELLEVGPIIKDLRIRIE